MYIDLSPYNETLFTITGLLIGVYIASLLVEIWKDRRK